MKLVIEVKAGAKDMTPQKFVEKYVLSQDLILDGDGSLPAKYVSKEEGVEVTIVSAE